MNCLTSTFICLIVATLAVLCNAESVSRVNMNKKAEETELLTGKRWDSGHSLLNFNHTKQNLYAKTGRLIRLDNSENQNIDVRFQTKLKSESQPQKKWKLLKKRSKNVSQSRTDRNKKQAPLSTNSSFGLCGKKCDLKQCQPVTEAVCQTPTVKDLCGCCYICGLSAGHEVKHTTTTTFAHSPEQQHSGSACERMVCSKFEECILNIQGIPICRCPNIYGCRGAMRDPVCTKEGQSFRNRCFLKVEECLQNRKIKVAYNGICSTKNGKKFKDRKRRENFGNKTNQKYKNSNSKYHKHALKPNKHLHQQRTQIVDIKQRNKSADGFQLITSEPQVMKSSKSIKKKLNVHNNN